MQEKIVLIGAGSVEFTRGIVRDLVSQGEEVDLALVDINPEALAVAENIARKMVEGAGVPIQISASLDRREVLSGATAVICMIAVGGRRAWEQDVFIPRKYGIYQPVGDSITPGGASRAFRMVPAMVSIAEDVLDLAPDALFFNYANPMSVICRAVRKATGANLVGLCIGVYGVAGYLAGALGVDRSRLSYTAVGMNHLTWFTNVRVDDTCAMSRLREIAKQRRTERENLLSNSASPEEAFAQLDNPFSWDLFELFGAFPSALDRHVVEFFPHLFHEGNYYGQKLGVGAFSLEQMVANGDRLFNDMKAMTDPSKQVSPDYFAAHEGEHTQCLEIIDSIRADAKRVYSVNLPNTGQIPNLASEAVIECPAIAATEGLIPIKQQPLPSALLCTLATRLAWVETVVEAALEGSREKFIQALVLDGSVNSIATATKLADELLAAHAEHLPQFACPTAHEEKC